MLTINQTLLGLLKDSSCFEKWCFIRSTRNGIYHNAFGEFQDYYSLSCNLSFRVNMPPIRRSCRILWLKHWSERSKLSGYRLLTCRINPQSDELKSPVASPQHNDVHSRMEIYPSILADVELRASSPKGYRLIADLCRIWTTSKRYA